MPVITLTTDLGLKDHYVSAVKGAILSQLPDVTIVDVSHDVPPFDMFYAAYMVKNAFVNFPPGSVHIIGVNAQLDPEAPFAGVQAKGHYFIGADNGTFSLLFDLQPDLVVDLNLKPEPDSLSFPLRDIFVKAACHLARGGTLEIIGTRKEGFRERTLFRPVIEGNMLRGTVIYIDSYGNVICNITRDLFKEAARGREFNISFGRYSIDTISQTYNDVSHSEILAMFNSAGYLELAMNQGKISSLLGIKHGSTITVSFNG